MGERIKNRIPTSEDGGKNVDRQWESVHLRKEGHQEAREDSQRPPFPSPSGHKKTEGKKEYEQHVENHRTPKTVTIIAFHYGSSSFVLGVVFSKRLQAIKCKKSAD
jgi:hypothetical protein